MHTKRARSAADLERDALGLSEADQELLASVSAAWRAPGTPGPLWDRIQRTRWASEGTPGYILQLGWWQLVADPARLFAPGLTALLIIAGEWFSGLVPGAHLGLDAWAVMAPWLGLWALGRTDGPPATGALAVLTAAAPVGRRERYLARWGGAVATALAALVVALLAGGAASPQWLPVASLGFVASLAVGLATTGAVRPGHAHRWLVTFAVLNLLAVVAADAGGHANLIPALVLVRVWPLTLVGSGVLFWLGRRGVARRWRASM